ncbi:uncharacterized protein [Syngnathus scovelli]|uniref:uncharacterized protein n=1 Tax=Syngnathus scovelli TaxID=161590 RepID=UPI0021108DA2|nr:uncharacterized protein LOC125966669 [Syngnathus scovelli]
MSTEDFQTKYACFIDRLVKSTVAETTKLFETVVDELKAELSKVKTENEALKTTCRQIANAKINAIKEPGQNGCSNIQDTAVQCDILPYHLWMVAQPVVQSGEEQVKQCKEEQMLYIVLNNHDGVAEKEENPDMTVSIPNHEDSEPTVASQNILCTFPDPPPTTACENEIRDPEISQQCLTEELRKRQDTQVTSLDGGHNLPEAPNQSIQPVNYVISLAGINDVEAGQISAQSSEESEVRTELPSLGDVLNVESTLWNKQLGEKAKYILAKVKTEWETGAQNDTERNITTPKIVNSFPQAMCSGSATVQDAILLLDAMGHSKNRSAPQEVPTPQDCCLGSPLASVVSSPLPSPPTADVSGNGVEEVTTDETLFDARTTQSDNQFNIGAASEHQQQDGVASSDMASTSSATSNSLGATVVPDPAPLKVKSPSLHPQETTAPLSPNQISVSKVKPARNKRVASSSFGLFRRKRKVNSRTSAPLVTSDKTIGSTQQRSNPTVFKKVKIIIRRAPDVEASPPQLPETLNQDAIGPAVAMTSSEEPNAVAQVTSDQNQFSFQQAEPSSPQTNFCDGFQISPGEQAATKSVAITGSLSPPRPESEQMNISEEKTPGEQAESLSSPTPPTSPQMEPSSEPASFCPNLTPEEEAAASSSEGVPRNSRPLVPLIKLERLPRLSAVSVLLPQSLNDDSESVPAGDSASSLLDDQALKTTTHPSQVSTSSCPDLNGSSTIPEELCGPHLPLTQIQLLAQVCLAPVIQNAEKASPNKSAQPQILSDARGGKKLGKESIIVHPRTTRNTYSQTKRTKTEPEPQTGKKAKLETVQDPTPKPVPVPTGPPKENTFSRPSLRNQQKSATITQSKTVSVRTRNPMVRLCRLSLKGALFVIPSPHTAANVRVRSRKDSTAKTSKNRLSRTKIAHEKNINLPRHQPVDKIKKEKTKITSEQKFQLHPTGMKNAPSEPLWIYKAPEELIAKQESDSLGAKSGSSSVQSPKLANGSVVKTREKSGSNQKSTVEENPNVQDTKKSVKMIKTESNTTKPIIHQPAGNKWPSPIVRVGETPQPLRFVISKKELLKNQCRYCGRILCDSTSLNSHIKLHTGHRPFCCKLCPKNFPNGRGLKRHMKVHRKERKHVCKQCGKGFVYKFDLTKHVQMVHGKMKPFICQLCSKAFFTKRDVETHIRGHNGEKPYHCHLCEKRFLRSTELSAHLRWHRGEKRHWCPYCGKGFFDQTNLKRHKYIHTGEKPHSCPHCPKQFTQSGHLKKHVKNVHKVQ